jgi:hypothetical protein
MMVRERVKSDTVGQQQLDISVRGGRWYTIVLVRVLDKQERRMGENMSELKASHRVQAKYVC